MEPTTRPPDQPTTRAAGSNRVVLFADILGFAALTEANPIDLRMLYAYGRLPQSPEALEEMIGDKNPLTETFSHFHHSLKWAIMTAKISHPLTAITFSDSVFVATAYLSEATTFANNLALSMLSQKIPVRMGIAFGSFAAINFRTDVSADGGDHAVQFLGTAVVRAYEAEKCGVKGMRILLHPSVEPLLTDRIHNPPSIPIGTNPVRPLEISNIECPNKSGVRYEVNYWDLATTKERSAWHGLQDMWALAPDSAAEHYQATAEAINRMRTTQGEVPLADLRRRTLPRHH